MKKVYTAAIMLLTMSSYGQDAAGRSGLVINPVTVSFNLLPGQTESAKLSITNQLKVKKQFTLYLSDWYRDTTGAHNYSAPGKNKRSCASWVTADKTFFELMPGATEEIIIKMTVPDSTALTAEMKWCMVFLETVEEQTAEQGSGIKTTINNRFRFGVHIYQTPPSATKKEVRMLRFDPVPLMSNKYRIICENSGEVQVTCTSYIELAALTDGKRIKLPAVDFPLFPGQKRFVDFQVPDSVPKGKYTLTAVVDAGVDVPLEAAQLIIEII